MPRHRISDAHEWIDTLVVAVKRGNPPIPPNPDVYLCSQMHAVVCVEGFGVSRSGAATGACRSWW